MNGKYLSTGAPGIRPSGKLDGYSAGTLDFNCLVEIKHFPLNPHRVFNFLQRGQ